MRHARSQDSFVGCRRPRCPVNSVAVRTPCFRTITVSTNTQRCLTMPNPAQDMAHARAASTIDVAAVRNFLYGKFVAPRSTSSCQLV
jgi:hypothetical protein